LNLEHAYQAVLQSGFNPGVFGSIFTDIVDSDPEFGVDRAIAFAAIVAKARQARLRRRPAAAE
jgi:hypothetical protein